jgi:putative copper resistance protein D
VEAELALAQRIATVLLNLSVAGLVGAAAAGLWLRRTVSPWAGALSVRLHGAMKGAALAAALAYVAVLWLEAAAMAEVPPAAAFPAVQSVITATHYGLAWMIGAAALLVLGLTLMRRESRGPVPSLVRLLALATFLYSRSMVSHAAAGGDFAWGVAADWVHLLLVSVWVGEVLVAGLAALRTEPADPQSRRECAADVQALSRSATIALAGIVLTGAFSAWRGLGAIGNAFGNPYATTLLVKLALVLCAAALGGLNRFLVMPALLDQLRQAAPPRQGAGRRFALILRLEAVFLAGALVAAVFLGSTSPPSLS